MLDLRICRWQCCQAYKGEGKDLRNTVGCCEIVTYRGAVGDAAVGVRGGRSNRQCLSVCQRALYTTENFSTGHTGKANHDAKRQHAANSTEKVEGTQKQPGSNSEVQKRLAAKIIMQKHKAGSPVTGSATEPWGFKRMLLRRTQQMPGSKGFFRKRSHSVIAF